MPNLSSPLQLFLNPSRIQIQTQFFCGSQFITVAGPTFFFLPIFSLSPPVLLCFSLLLSAITEPLILSLHYSRPNPSHCSSLQSHAYPSHLSYITSFSFSAAPRLFLVFQQTTLSHTHTHSERESKHGGTSNGVRTKFRAQEDSSGCDLLQARARPDQDLRLPDRAD